MKILITGVCGFIGMHTAIKLLENGCEIFGVDSVNDYYDVELKQDRLKNIIGYEKFKFIKLDISIKEDLNEALLNEDFDCILNFAAQAGVRYSIENPGTYIRNNIDGFLNILEFAKSRNIAQIIYASSSSVYGSNNKSLLTETDITDSPISIYAATKKSNELMAHVYSSLYNIETIGLRFFTVYGPWGRPDMSPMLFADAISSNKELNIYNNGNMTRDFTYVEDVVEAILRILKKSKEKNTRDSNFKIFNVGGGSPIKLMDYINKLEMVFKKTARKKYMPLQPGDMINTEANHRNLEEWIGYVPATNIDTGLQKFASWYIEYYKK